MHQLQALIRKVTWTPHVPIGAMILVAFWLGVGSVASGSWKAVAAIATYALTAVATYSLLVWSTRALRLDQLARAASFALAVPPDWKTAGLLGAAGVAIGTSFVHYAWFDGFTLPAALSASTNFEVAMIREEVTNDLPTWMRYLSSFAMKSLFPIGLLLSVMHRRYWAALVFALGGSLYAVCLMQKAYAIIFILPLMTYYLVNLRLIRAGACFVFSVVLVFWMSAVANTGVLQQIEQQTEQQTEQPVRIPEGELATSKTTVIGGALMRRLFVTPGAVVAQWIDLIPDEIAYGGGCGYRFAAPFLDCQFRNYPLLVYDHLHPDNVERGLQGSVNAASMMTEYANFGFVGFVMSGLLHATVAWGLYLVFAATPQMTLPVNITYLALLSSASLFTTLLSGGWMLSVALFLTLGQNVRGTPVRKLASARPFPTRGRVRQTSPMPDRLL